MIVPYIYEDAYHYWYDLWEAQQRNKNAQIEKITLPAREIYINPPRRKPMKHLRKLFNFLDEEEGNE